MFGGKRLIIYELNEVPLKILDWFSQQRPRSNVAKLVRDGRVMETVTEDEGHLSPWITWPTMHRGVVNKEHGIYEFGQKLAEVNRDLPPIWELLTRNGCKVGMFGSLHTYPLPDKLDHYSFYVPDTFAAGPECFPKHLTAFQKFNLAMVDQNGRNVSRGLPLRDAAKFMAAAPGLGLRGTTALKIARQLAEERVKPTRVVRRRTSQVQIAFDFFLKELGRTSPEVAFFFTNHVASSMHRFWPATFPEDYRKPFWDDTWASTWDGEIPYAVGEADQQLGALMNFVERDSRYALVVATSMGQAAVNEVESLARTQLNFDDLRRFMRLLGIPDDQWQRARAMIPIYVVSVASGLLNAFTDRLAEVKVNGEPIAFAYRGEGVFAIALGQTNLAPEDIHVTYDDRRISLEEAGMVNLRLQDEASSNAYHVPQGSLVFYDPALRPEAVLERQTVSTREFAPAVLANFGIEPPSHMVRPQFLI